MNIGIGNVPLPMPHLKSGFLSTPFAPCRRPCDLRASASIGAWTAVGRYKFLVAERRSDTHRCPMVCFLQQSKAKAQLSMMHSKVICCKLYISESPKTVIVDEITRIAQEDPQVDSLEMFGDEHYNRVRYTLVSYIINDMSAARKVVFSPITNVLLAMIRAAFSAINLENHCGSHPRIGVIDDISFHPLGQAATVEDAAELAKLVAFYIGDHMKVPVFLYGAAHPSYGPENPDGKLASAVRHKLGYYEPNHNGINWKGPVLSHPLPMKPDAGQNDVSRERGATMVGAMPFVMGYNVPIHYKKPWDAKTVRSIAELVRETGGGGYRRLPTVKALGLPHGDNCMEVACLLDPDRVSAHQVQSRVKKLAEEKEPSLEVKKGYSGDLSKDEMLKRYIKMVSAADCMCRVFLADCHACNCIS